MALQVENVLSGRIAVPPQTPPGNSRPALLLPLDEAAGPWHTGLQAAVLDGVPHSPGDSWPGGGQLPGHCPRCLWARLAPRPQIPISGPQSRHQVLTAVGQPSWQPSTPVRRLSTDQEQKGGERRSPPWRRMSTLRWGWEQAGRLPQGSAQLCAGLLAGTSGRTRRSADSRDHAHPCRRNLQKIQIHKN